MFSAKEIASYFLSKDPDKVLFNDKIVKYNGRTSYEGNIRLNKYLFLSQVVYLAKYNKKLIKDDFNAYDNGPVIECIVSSYKRIKNMDYNLDNDTMIFLDKIYKSLENASYEELIEITHEDPEWIKLSKETYKAPKMNIEDHIDEYKKRYKGLIEALKI